MPQGPRLEARGDVWSLGTEPSVLPPASARKQKTPRLLAQTPGAVATGPTFVQPIHPTPLGRTLARARLNGSFWSRKPARRH
jgi:hypothetical protein